MLRIIKMPNFVNGYIIQNKANYDNNNKVQQQSVVEGSKIVEFLHVIKLRLLSA